MQFHQPLIDILNCLGTLFQIILHVLLFKLLNPPSPDHNFHKLCRQARRGKTFSINNLVLMSYPCIETATYFKIHPRIKLSVSNLSHVLFIYFMFLFKSNSFQPGTVLKPCFFGRNNPEYRLTVVALVPFGAVATSFKNSRVLKFRSQNNKARLKGPISVKLKRLSSKNASSVISRCHQSPPISRKYFDSNLFRRSCRTITEENILGVLLAE